MSVEGESRLRRVRCQGYDEKAQATNAAYADDVPVLIVMEYQKYAYIVFDLGPTRRDLTEEAEDAVDRLFHDYFQRGCDDKRHNHSPVRFGTGGDHGDFDRLRVPVAEELADALEEIVGDSANWRHRNG